MSCSRHFAARAAIAAAALSMVSATAIAQGNDTNPRISPTVGSRATTYTFHLTARPDIVGNRNVRTAYAVRVSLPGHPTCGRSFTITKAQAGETVTVRLHPRRLGGWCRGRYRGTVSLSRGPRCAKSGLACARFASVILPAGTFRFRVR